MQRVQAALGAQLTRQNEKLEIELREKVSFTIPAFSKNTLNTPLVAYR